MRGPLSITLFIYLSVCFTANGAQSQSFSDALNSANSDEQSLNEQYMSSLIASQSKLMREAMPKCVAQTQYFPSQFSLVIKLDTNGQVQKTWVAKKTAFTDCLEDAISRNFSYSPPHAPFYTAIQYSAQ